LERLGTVAIVGVGLIGGSVGLALRARGLAERVVGIGRSEARLAEAVRLGSIDAFTTEPARGFAEAEVAVVCTPVNRIADDVRLAAEHGPEGILVTDAGSTKQRIVEAAERHDRARAAFVAAHPIAGSERNGVAHARADLLEGRVCVLTPTRHTPADRLTRARAFWAGLSCRLIEMAPDAHDEALARTSHLPHVVAAALAAAVPPESLPMAGGAYRDGTRVAAADTDLWAAIFRENRLPLLNALAAFEEQLAAFKLALAAEDQDAVRRWWDAARARRARFDSLNTTPPIDD
jgi:prephenate dehydrogenase